ncbi:MAG: hypothetical protein H6599_04805 [Flavobacteriales bacterium]|nr:hypothetical protein [Flavobacteriales bacterium]
MKKLQIHRDTQEPSMESMQNHMNFDEILKRASVESNTPIKGNGKGWIIGGTIAGVVIVTAIIYSSQISRSESTYQNIPMEHKSIEKIAFIEPVVEETIVITPVSVSNPSVLTTQETKPISDPSDPPIQPQKIEYFYPVVVSSIAFPFDEGFGLKEQWQQFPELSIYDNLAFQPIDKLQSSLLKVSWEKVKFNKDPNGQYYLTLIKGDQAVHCAVAPVFEKEDFVHALEVYQEHK